MIAVSIPMNIGEVVWTDQSMTEQVRDHPILDIGSSYSGLKVEVVEWLTKNCQDRYMFGHNYRTYELRFDSPDDALLFKLRWL